MGNELEAMWHEAIVPLSRQNPVICLDGLKKPQGTSVRIPDVPDRIRNTDIAIRINVTIFTEMFLD
jgi:hypothetical protein